MRKISSPRLNNPLSSIQSLGANNKLALFAVLFAVVGVIIVFFARASSTSNTSIEPELATQLISPATHISDTTASGGAAIQFSSITTSPPTSGGRVYYIDCVGGSDTNVGTSEATAWKTLTKASSQALSAGETIALKRGCTFNEKLTVVSSGNAMSPITISAYKTGNAPVITQSASSGAIITLRGSFINVQDLNIVGNSPTKTSVGTCTNQPVGTLEGISIEANANNNSIKNNTFTGNYAGIFIRGGSRNNTITNNSFTNNTMLNSGGSAGAFGILVWGSYNDIGFNNFSGNNACTTLFGGYDGASVEIFGGNTASQDASFNKIHHNKSVNDNAFTELGGSSSLPDSLAPTDNIYYYNSYSVTGISNAIFLASHGNDGSGYDPVLNTKMYNNVTYSQGSTKWGIYCGSCNEAHLTFKNNIVVTGGSNPLPYTLSTVTNNLGWTTNNTSSTSNPKFVNAAVGDFHLQAGSPAINTGTNETVSLNYTKDLDNKSVPVGGTVDIGAYEYGAIALNSSSRYLSYNSAWQAVSKVAQGLKSVITNTMSNITGSIQHSLRNIIAEFKVKPAKAASSITIAVVGDMNRSGSTSVTSEWGKIATVIKTGLADGSISNFIGLGDFQYSSGYCNNTSQVLNTQWGQTVRNAAPTSFTLEQFISKTYHIAGPTHDLDIPNNFAASDHQNFFSGQCGQTARSASNTTNLQGKTAISPLDAYSFDIGRWHFIALPTALIRYGTTAQKDAVKNFITSDLTAARNAGKYLAAVYHDPYYTSDTSSHGRETGLVSAGWIQAMDQFAIAFSLSGSQHNYERSCPIKYANDACTAENGNGVVAYNVSTGGTGLRAFTTNPSYIVSRFSDSYGFMKITLNDDGSFSSNFVRTSSTGTGSDNYTRPSIYGPSSPTPAPDTQPPMNVSITYPPAGNVQGQVKINGTATDNVAISKIEFYDGAIKLGEDTTAPYEYNWDTTTSTQLSSHSLTIKAFDTSNLSTSSTPVVVTVNNPCPALPSTLGQATITISIPTTGTYRVWSRVMASDSTNNSYLLQTNNECNIVVGDSATIPTDAWTWVSYRDGNTASPVSLSLNAGTQTFTLAGRESGVKLDRILLVSDSCVPNATSNGDNCIVGADTTPPTSSISSPANLKTNTNGTSVKQNTPVTIIANASDNGSGIRQVDYYVNSTLVGSDTTNPYSYTWTPTNIGSYNIRALAVDNVGLTSVASNDNQAKINVTDGIAPTVSISSPTSGATVSNTVPVAITSNDNIGVTTLDLYVDDVKVGSSNGTNPAIINWDSRQVANGTRILKVVAADVAGNSTTSATTSVTVLNDQSPPTAPTNLTANATAPTQVNLAWKASTDDIGPINYVIMRNNVAVAETSSLTFIDTASNNVTASTTYTYAVIAHDASGKVSSSSNTQTITTPQFSAKPTAPANLSAIAMSTNQINLSWSASTGDAGVAGYNVYRNTSTTGTYTKISTVTTTSYGDSSLSADTSYSYYVKAFDPTGLESDASPQTTMKTLSASTKPTTPSNFNYVVFWFWFNYKMTVNWTASSSSIGIDHYEVSINSSTTPRIVTAPSIQIDNLPWGYSIYNFNVRAIDKNGVASDPGQFRASANCIWFNCSKY